MSKSVTLNDFIQQAIDSRLLDVHTSMIAQVEVYDAQTRKASVKPQLSRRLRDDRELELPVINDVPVIWPGTSNSILSMPLTKGDTVLIVFIERSIDEWLSLGVLNSPEDKRRHDLSDAVAIPGLFYFGIDNGADAVDLRLRFKDSDIKITNGGDLKFSGGPLGKVAIGNDQEELLDLLDQLIAMLITSTTATSIGNQPLSVSISGQLATLQADLAKIKGTL
jgi:hypothetical protein